METGKLKLALSAGALALSMALAGCGGGGSSVMPQNMNQRGGEETDEQKRDRLIAAAGTEVAAFAGAVRDMV